jgi:hypothetical protein
MPYLDVPVCIQESMNGIQSFLGIVPCRRQFQRIAMHNAQDEKIEYAAGAGNGIRFDDLDFRIELVNNRGNFSSKPHM